MIKQRTVITTDGEVDDMNSFMRALLYSNEMDLAGIVLTASQFHYAGDENKGIVPFRWTGSQWPFEIIDLYEKVYHNLISHDPSYPSPDRLREITKIGNISFQGEMDEVTEGSEFLKSLFLDEDERTLYVQTWGGTNTTARALKSIEEEYEDTEEWEAVYRKVADKLVLFIILDQDESYSLYIQDHWKDLTVIKDVSDFWHFAYAWPFNDEAVNQTLHGEWQKENLIRGEYMQRYALMGDGKMLEGELFEEQRGTEQWLEKNPFYHRYDFISEGDSPGFLYLLDRGLGNPENPSYGGWGSRFEKEDEHHYINSALDYNPVTKRYEASYSLTRWISDIQNDFAARIEWTLTDDDSAVEHLPVISVQEGNHISAQPGEMISLHVISDRQACQKLHWWHYFEAGTYGNAKGTSSVIGEGLQLDLVREPAEDEDVSGISLHGADTSCVSFEIPSDARHQDTIHIIVSAENSDRHHLKSYQRVIVTVV